MVPYGRVRYGTVRYQCRAVRNLTAPYDYVRSLRIYYRCIDTLQCIDICQMYRYILNTIKISWYKVSIRIDTLYHKPHHDMYRCVPIRIMICIDVSTPASWYVSMCPLLHHDIYRCAPARIMICRWNTFLIHEISWDFMIFQYIDTPRVSISILTCIQVGKWS